MSIFVTRSSLPSYEEYCEEIKKIWHSHCLTNMGEEHHQLELLLKNYLKCKNLVLFSNGHLALESVIEAMNLPNKGEVITTPFTFASTTHAIVRKGLTPVFCDVNYNDYTIDVSLIEGLITEKTVAIVPVHIYGTICDVEKIAEIANKYGLKVIYDAAHAFSVTYKGISSANLGDASIFSFHATKVFNTVEGGAVCFRDSYLEQILNDIKNFGIRNQEEVVFAGGNAKMSEFHAAMGICNLRHLSDEIDKRKKVVYRYRKNLSKINGIKILGEQINVQSNYAYFPVVFDGYKFVRDDIFKMLSNEGIHARKYFYPLTNSFECYSKLSTTGCHKTPTAEYIADRVLTLPLYADLSFDVVDKICSIILG